MVELKDINCKETSGNYERLFGNKALGDLVSKAHSATIKTGNILEKIIIKELENQNRIIQNCDDFFETDIYPPNTYLIPKKALKKSKHIDFPKAEPDFVILKNSGRGGRERHCYIIELKYGDNFDTKKAFGEKSNLQSFENYIAKKLSYTTSIYVCFFHSTDKNQVIKGFKNKVNENEAMTGIEFCELLNIDYKKIISILQTHQEENLRYFIEEVLKINSQINLAN